MAMIDVFLNRMLTVFFARVSPGLEAREPEVHDEDQEGRHEHPGVVHREQLLRHRFRLLTEDHMRRCKQQHRHQHRPTDHRPSRHRVLPPLQGNRLVVTFRNSKPCSMSKTRATR